MEGLSIEQQFAIAKTKQATASQLAEVRALAENASKEQLVELLVQSQELHIAKDQMFMNLVLGMVVF